MKKLAKSSTFKKLRSWHLVTSFHSKQKEKKVEAMTNFLFLDSKTTVDGDCSHKIKTLAPWKKSMINLDSILISRDITLSTKVCLVKAMVFPVVMYECASWTVKKAEC